MLSRNRTSIITAIGLLFALGSACRHKPTPAELVQQGTTALKAGKFQEATIRFRQAIQANPKLGDARLKLGDAYLGLEDPRSAAREYQRAADLLPASIEAQLKAGQILLLGRAFEDAKARADRALEIDPKNVAAQVLRGNALAGLKDLDGAITEYEDAIALDPTQSAAYASLGRVQLSQGNRDEAERTFRKAVSAAPNSVPARLALANFLWATGRGPECEQTLKSALAIDPKDLVANRALALFYMATGRAAEAEPFVLTIAHASTDAVASLALADYYTLVKKYDEARKVLGDVGRRPDASTAAILRLASIDVLEGAPAQAEARIDELLVKSPKDATALLLKARLLYKDGKRDEALTTANRVLAGQPAPAIAAQAHLLAGRINAITNRSVEAIADYEQVLKLEGRPLEADAALAELYLSRGNPAKAATYAQQALVIQPKSPTVQVLLIRTDIAEGALDKAKSELAPLQKAFPNSPQVANLTAEIQLKQNQPDAARASYARALHSAPNDFEALAGSVDVDIRTGKTNDAVTLLEGRLAQSGTPNVELMLLAARAYIRMGNVKRSEELLEQSIEIEPDHLEAYALLSGLYAGEHRLGEAVDDIKAWLKREPKSVPANTLLGMLFERQGHGSEAEAQYVKTISIEPRASVAANNLAWIYVASDRKLDEALQLAQTAYQLLPAEPNVNDTLGWIYYRKNMAAQAIPYLETSAQKDPNQVWFQFHLGMAYVQSGDFVRARKALKQALALKPDFEGAAEAQKALTELGS